MSESSTSLAGPKLSPECFRLFARFVTEHTGIKMPETKVAMLESRLQRRLRALRLSSLDEYQQYLFRSPQAAAELGDFINAVTTNKTDFFREPQHFEYLRDVALRALGPADASAWTARLWCAGCSSGEEAYTLAMVLAEQAEVCRGFEFQILATDISTRVLQIAQDAIYEASRIGPIEERLRKKYLLRSRDRTRNLVRIVPELRTRVCFHPLNFMDAEYGVNETFDAVFFRNVMIYFDKPTQQRVVQRLCRHLRPGGFLFIGHSESLMGLDLPLQMVGSAVYRKCRPAGD